MRSSSSEIEEEGYGNALVALQSQGALVERNADLAVIPPRPLPIAYRARRSFVRATVWGSLAALCAFSGYAYRDPDIRRGIDYRLTLLTTPGMSKVVTHRAGRSGRAAAATPLPGVAKYLFVDNHKGPRADRFALAMRMGVGDGVVRRTKGDPLRPNTGTDSAMTVAGAQLFLTAFAPRTGPLFPGASAEAAPAPGPAPESAPAQQNGGSGQWAGLLKNAVLSPEQPKTLFGGLTEDEFRMREMRCMATAIYFEARDEPVKGQIAVAQVIMNRIRSPFYPKTVCGVVYQGERNRHGCQFSFTCTGKHNSVKEKPEWATAVKLAKQVIAGEVWLEEVGYATHYHATYVHPEWRHELIQVTQIGGHIFYKMKPGTVQVALLSEGL